MAALPNPLSRLWDTDTTNTTTGDALKEVLTAPVSNATTGVAIIFTECDQHYLRLMPYMGGSDSVDGSTLTIWVYRVFKAIHKDSATPPNVVTSYFKTLALKVTSTCSATTGISGGIVSETHKYCDGNAYIAGDPLYQLGSNAVGSESEIRVSAEWCDWLEVVIVVNGGGNRTGNALWQLYGNNPVALTS